MNLGQAIAAGSGEAAPQRERSRPAPCPPLGVVNVVCKDKDSKAPPAGLPVSRKSNGLSDCVRLALGALPPAELLTVDQIADLVEPHGYDFAQLRSALTHMVHSGDLWSEGKRGALRFRLTEKGRGKL